MRPPVRSLRFTAVSLVGVLLGALVLTACAGNSPDANTVAKYLPANTLAFTTVALSPSVHQKADLALMSQHLPADVKTTKANEAKDKLLASLFSDQNLNYNTDIKPWLGTEAAVAVLPPADGNTTPIAVAAIQTDKSDQAIALLQKKNVSPDTYKYLKGYIFIVDNDQLKNDKASTAFDSIQSVIDGKSPSLQSTSKYTNDISLLTGQHIVLGWVDLSATAKVGITAAKAKTTKGDSVSSLNMSNAAYVKPVSDSTTSDAGSALVGSDDGSLDDGSLDDGSLDSDTTDDSGDFGSDFSPSFTDTLLQGLETNALTDNNGSDEKVYTKVQSQADAVGGLAFELYATSNGISFRGVTEHQVSNDTNPSDHTLFNGLDGATTGAYDIGNFGTLGRSLYSEITSSDNQSADSFDKSFPAVKQLIEVLGNEATFAVTDPAGKNLGFVAQVTDQNIAIGDVMSLVAEPDFADNTTISNFDIPDGKGWLLDEGDTKIYVAVANKRLVIASSEDEAKALAAGTGTFAASSAVHDSLGDNSQATSNEISVDLKSAIAESEKDDTDRAKDGKSKQWEDTLSTFGLKTYADSGHDYLEVNLTFK